MASFLVDPTAPGTIPVTDSGDDIDTSPSDGILTVKDVVQLTRKSETWVYRHWPELGGVKVGGSVFFPSKEIVYEHIFGKGQRLASGLQSKRGTLHPSVVPFKNKSKASHDKAAKRAKRLTKPFDPNRHGL
jgi:predicted DNA-binding transcriptional regulator AlpA